MCISNISSTATNTVLISQILSHEPPISTLQIYTGYRLYCDYTDFAMLTIHDPASSISQQLSGFALPSTSTVHRHKDLTMATCQLRVDEPCTQATFRMGKSWTPVGALGMGYGWIWLL